MLRHAGSHVVAEVLTFKDGLPVGISTEARNRIRGLEKENRELRWVNEIPKAAAAFFGTELDRKQ